MSKNQSNKNVLQTNNQQKRVQVEKGIYYDNNTKNYIVSFFYGRTANGKQQRHSKTFFTLQEARKAKKQFEAEKQLKLQPPPPSKIKLSVYIQKFIDNSNRTPCTIYSYTRTQKRVNNFYIATMSIEKITPDNIRDYVKYLQAETEMKPQTINKDLIFLSTVFKRAYKDELIRYNPIEKVDKLPIPAEQKYNVVPYTLNDCKQIFTALKSYSNINVKLLIYFGVLLGLRRGEMAGLKWDKIDLQNSKLHIVESKTKAGGKVIIKSPKSTSSVRVLDIPKPLKELLDEVKQYQIEKFGGCDYVMVNPQTGKGISPASLQKPFKIFLQKAHIRELRIHDLRHTFATIAIHSEQNIFQVSKSLGHSTPQITQQIYLHPYENDNTEVVNAVSNSIFKQHV